MASCKYDVFLSFRGEDTRYNFTSHLHHALCRKQIKTFIDDEELSRGDEISPALLNAIEGSKISIIVFSKDYASSKWCLNELVKILQCHQLNGQMVVPVFYHVDPSDVRKQTGNFRDAFVKHENEIPEKVQNWRAVLTEASNLSGWASKEISSEAELVDAIVNDILKKLEKITVSTGSDGLVGLNSRMEEIKSLLCMELSGIVQIVGIWGMGGIGKTTLARAIFNQFSVEFEGCCFIEDVRRKSEPVGGLKDLQKQIFSIILREKLEVEGPNIPQFTKERVRRMKVLIVLDDVNEVGQLDGLIGGLNHFGPGSRIVITTRDKGVLEKFGVEKIYGVNGLEYKEAFELFCNRAFKESHCPKDLKGHSWRLVKFCKGNPLALKVLGSSFKGKTNWEKALENLNEICRYDINKIDDVLKTSFNDLMLRDQSIFLDIACFFVGEDKNFVANILDDSESYGLDVLMDKSLITISDSNKLQMHDLLQEMGRKIVCEESMPGKRSRLWCHKDICHILKHNEGTEKIQGIFLDLSKTEDVLISHGAFANMRNLRLLKFYMPEQTGVSITSSKVHIDKGLESLPKKLRYLHWHQYPLETLPPNFEPENLVGLSLPYSKVNQLWEVKKKALKLTWLTDVWNRKNLACSPSSIQNFNHLKMLCLKGCESLRSFPGILHFDSPVAVNFSFCVNLKEFPQISGNVIELDLSGTTIEEVPSSIECLTDLKKLHLKGCRRLKRLPTSICKLKSLSNLYLGNCSNLESFPEILEKMEYLKHISLGEAAIAELPFSMENLEGLESLVLWRCFNLDTLPDNIGNLKSLTRIYAHNSAISHLPSSVLDSSVLKTVSIVGCRGLVSWPPLSSSLPSMIELDLRECAIDAIPEDIGCLSALKELDLSGNNFRSLPKSVKQLSKLNSLRLNRCNMLESLPELPLFLNFLYARDCRQLQSLPEIQPCTEEIDTSILERQSHDEASPYCLDDRLSLFTNCVRLNENENKILADAEQRILQMGIEALRLSVHEKVPGIPAAVGTSIILPGSEIPGWFKNRSLGSSITIQLPHKTNLIGFAFSVAVECTGGEILKFSGKFQIQILSKCFRGKLFNEIYEYIPSDHVILGFTHIWNVGLPDDNQLTTASFSLFACYEESHKSNRVKCIGVCPLFANPNEANPNLLTLKFLAGIQI